MADQKINSTNNLMKNMRDMGNGTFAEVVAAVSLNPDGTSTSDKRQYQLLTAQSAQGNGPATGPVSGGDYIWRVESPNWNGATATLQFLGLDGATWFPVRNAGDTADVARTTTGSVAVGIAQGSILRVVVSATNPTNMNSQLAGL